MTNTFQFDLNNAEQFPVLNRLSKYLDTFTPHEELDFYWHKQYNPEMYNGEPNTEAETFEQAKKDINRIIGVIKGKMLRMIVAPETSIYLRNLVKERDLFAINLPDNQRNFNIKTYNRYVIEKVEGYSNSIHFRLSTTFAQYFQKVELENLNIRNSLNLWYENFGDVIEGQQSQIYNNSDKIKLIWKGQKNQLYNVLRQLKNDYELIGNSYNSIADFLIENVTGFENTGKETIEKELKKTAPLPKAKRINITPGEVE